MARRSAASRAKANFDPMKQLQLANAAQKNQAQAPDQDKDKEGSTIVFFHPDLGIGGAERLVVDAAVGLQERGHRVAIFTNHCDPSHCFDECRDGTLDVRVRASGPVPMSLFGRFTILCAVLRHIQLLLFIAFTGELAALRPRAFIVDQLSAGLPLLSWLRPECPILFYCHFPDLLLVRGRESSILKRAYRVPFDALEQWSMSFAESIAVNSEFTKGIVKETWPDMAKKAALRVVYPCVDTGSKEKELRKSVERVLEGDKIVLSINRFERKKNIDLAIHAFAGMPESGRKNVRLVIAGGYDARIEENVQYLSELQTLADKLSLSHTTITSTDSISSAPPVADCPILFLPSVPTPIKNSLLRSARLLLYTPSNEHFGIVPLEAMRARLPVLAATTGGPVESVKDGVTGWLRDTDDQQAWSEVMLNALAMSDGEIRAFGEAGNQRVKDRFGRDKMALRLDEIVDEMMQGSPPAGLMLNLIFSAIVIGVTFGMGFLIAPGYHMAKEKFMRSWAPMLGLT